MHHEAAYHLTITECFSWSLLFRVKHSYLTDKQANQPALRDIKPTETDMNAMTAASLMHRAPQNPPVHDAHNLTQGCGLAQILLDGKTYQLRITRAGKLILTK